MRGEHQARRVATVGGQLGPGRGDGVGDGGEEERMIVEVPQLGQRGRVVADGGAGAGDVLVILPAPRIATPGRGREHQGVAHPVAAHGRDGVLDHRVPVAVAEVDRQVQPGGGEIHLETRDEVAVEGVDRGHTAEVQVVLGDLVEAFGWHPPARG